MLFVCTANICRSPIAEALFNALAQDRGVPWEARSAGVAAREGMPISPRAGAALEEVGVFPHDHRARQVSAAMLESADLALAMTADQASNLCRLSGTSTGKVYTLAGYARGGLGGDVPDPYGRSMTVHRAFVREILGYLEEVIGHLERERWGARVPRTPM